MLSLLQILNEMAFANQNLRKEPYILLNQILSGNDYLAIILRLFGYFCVSVIRQSEYRRTEWIVAEGT
jgi:hypothetical protein